MRGNFPELRGDIFTCSISRGVAETYSRKRVYNCSYADSKFETFMSGIFTTVCYFIVRSLFLLFFPTCFSFSLSPSLFFRSLYPSFYQAALFLIPHERSVLLAHRRQSKTATKSELRSLGSSEHGRKPSGHNFQRSFNDRRPVHGFSCEL